MLFLPLVYNTQYSCWVSPYNILGFLGPFYSLGILSPFHSLGILGLFHSFLILTFPWALAKSFGFPCFNYQILYLWVYWPLNQSHLPIPFFGLLQPVFAFFLFLTIPMLSTSFFGASLAHLLSLGLLYYFVGLWTIIPAILAQWSLLCCFLSLPFSYCWVFSTIGPFC